MDGEPIHILTDTSSLEIGLMENKAVAMFPKSKRKFQIEITFDLN